MDVTVYSPATPCSSCKATKIALKMNRIPFSEAVASDVLVDDFRRAGHAAFPVVVVHLGDGATWTWSGYRHEDIKRLKSLMDEGAAAAA